jgi:hypothetical protein
VSGDADLVEVRLLRLPVPLWVAADEHNEELLREFALLEVAEDEAQRDTSVPARLLAVMAQVRSRYAGASGAQRERLRVAAKEGRTELDVQYALPPAAADAIVELNRMLDEADDYCREGKHLLTLATPEELVLFRRWYFAQIVEQVAGAPPVPWPDYRDSVPAV